MGTLCNFAIIVLLPHFVSVCSADDILVTTKNGKVRGKLLPVLNGSVGAFLGIPYAKPPVGKLRFRNPEPIDSWEGVKNATSFSNTCFQLADQVFPGESNISVYSKAEYMNSFDTNIILAITTTNVHTLTHTQCLRMLAKLLSFQIFKWF